MFCVVLTKKRLTAVAMSLIYLKQIMATSPATS